MDRQIVSAVHTFRISHMTFMGPVIFASVGLSLHKRQNRKTHFATVLA